MIRNQQINKVPIFSHINKYISNFYYTTSGKHPHLHLLGISIRHGCFFFLNHVQSRPTSHGFYALPLLSHSPPFPLPPSPHHPRQAFPQPRHRPHHLPSPPSGPSLDLPRSPEFHGLLRLLPRKVVLSMLDMLESFDLLGFFLVFGSIPVDGFRLWCAGRR